MKKLFFAVFLILISAVSYAQVMDESADFYARALKYYESGDNDAARRLLTQVVNMDSANPEVREKAEELLLKCQPKEGSEARIEVSEHNLNFSADGDFKEFNVEASAEWMIVESDPWCQIVESTRNYVKIWCEANPKQVSRSGRIVLSCRGEEAVVLLHQDPGKERKGRVYFRTKPHNTYLEVSNGNSGYSSSPLVFGVGEYSVRVSKEGYESKDTTLVFDAVNDTTRVIDIELVPLFGKIEPVVIDEVGNYMEDVEFKIGRMNIDVFDYANGHSFDDREAIQYYGFYREGVIPLRPGRYELSVSAAGFETFKTSVHVIKGRTQKVNVEMKSILGQLLIKNGKGAEGAEVYIPELKLHASVGDTLTVPVGEYSVVVRKDMHVLDSDPIAAVVEKGRLSEYNARMTRTVEMLISTEGGGERVYMNGTLAKEQNPMHKFVLAEGEEYDLEVKKEGYWHYTRKVKVSKEDTLFDFRNLHMEKVDTLWVDSDDPCMLIELKKLSDPDGVDYALGAETPRLNREKTELYVPYGKYRLILKRKNESKKSRVVAYRGKVNFTPTNDHVFARTWMVPSFAAIRIISAEAILYPKYDQVPDDFLPFPLEAGVFEIPLFKGLSTTIAKGALIYTKNYRPMPKAVSGRNTEVMPALSGPLMNYDFRMGGRFTQIAALNLLVSYNYYLEFEGLLQKYVKDYKSGAFDHFEGHDVFAGLELGTCFKGLNFYVRAGYQYLKGNRVYYYDHKADYLPLEQGAAVVKLGIDIGGRGAKGQNIIRIF